MSKKNNIFNNTQLSKAQIQQLIDKANNEIIDGIGSKILQGCQIVFTGGQSFQKQSGTIFAKSYGSIQEPNIVSQNTQTQLYLITQQFNGTLPAAISIIPNNHLKSTISRIIGRYNINRFYTNLETGDVLLLESPYQYVTLSEAIINNDHFNEIDVPNEIINNNKYFYLGSVILKNNEINYQSNDQVYWQVSNLSQQQLSSDSQLIINNVNDMPITGNLNLQSIYKITNSIPPSDNLDLTNKQYVDQQITQSASNLQIKNNDILNVNNQKIGEFINGTLKYEYQNLHPSSIQLMHQNGTQYINMRYQLNSNNDGLYFYDQNQNAILLLRQNDNNVVASNGIQINSFTTKTNPLDVLNKNQLDSQYIQKQGTTQQMSTGINMQNNLIDNCGIVATQDIEIINSNTINPGQNKVLNQLQTDAKYLQKSGDTMSGNLNMNHTNIVYNHPPGQGTGQVVTWDQLQNFVNHIYNELNTKLSVSFDGAAARAIAQLDP